MSEPWFTIIFALLGIVIGVIVGVLTEYIREWQRNLTRVECMLRTDSSRDGYLGYKLFVWNASNIPIRVQSFLLYGSKRNFSCKDRWYMGCKKLKEIERLSPDLCLNEGFSLKPTDEKIFVLDERICSGIHAYTGYGKGNRTYFWVYIKCVGRTNYYFKAVFQLEDSRI
jgi:hypothetical protein